MSVKKGSEESRLRASISGATAEGELKRKRETPPTEPKPRKRHHPDVTIYERPVLSVGVRSPGNNKFYRIRALFDTGSQFFGLSERVVAKLKIPRVKRDVPWLIQDYRGRTDEDGGEAHTELTEFKVLDRKFCETFQIIESEGRTDHDMVIPFGWALETGLQIVELPGGQGWKEAFTKPPKPTLDSTTWRYPTEDEFSVEWDESILTDASVEPIQIGSVVYAPGIPRMTPKGQWQPVQQLKCFISAVSGSSLREQLPERYHRFLELFEPSTAKKLPVRSRWDHAIDLEPGKEPPWGPVYSCSEKELSALREYLDEYLASGKIRLSKSSAGAPILFVPKPDGRGLRFCVDYRGLNKITVRNRHPLPRMDNLRDQVHGAKIFTKIDLKTGYNQIRIQEGDEWKTAFHTRYGHFEFLVMPLGLTNSGATFQAMMNDVLGEFIDRGVVVYLDDILIYSRNEEEHEELVSKVLQRLMDHGLAATIDKCFFHVREVEFLGYVISPKGIKMADRSIQAIKDWAVPKSVKDVQSFIGFANFYRRFIKNFSGICKPLTDLTKGDPKEFFWVTFSQVSQR